MNDDTARILALVHLQHLLGVPLVELHPLQLRFLANVQGAETLTPLIDKRCDSSQAETARLLGRGRPNPR